MIVGGMVRAPVMNSKLSLKFFFICIAILAVLLAWWSSRRTELNKKLKAISEHGGTVLLDCAFEGDHQIAPTVKNQKACQTATNFFWFSFRKIVYVDFRNSAIKDDDLTVLKGLQHLTTVDLQYTNITRSGIRRIADLGLVIRVKIDPSKFTEREIQDLQIAYPHLELFVSPEDAEFQRITDLMKDVERDYHENAKQGCTGSVEK